jgi:hypothetical protein
VEGVVINENNLRFVAMDGDAEELIETLIALSSLGLVPPNETRSRQKELEEVKFQLSWWARAYTHHQGDSKVPPSTRFSPANASIVPRVICAIAG